jgi:hypothetical protein
VASVLAGAAFVVHGAISMTGPQYWSPVSAIDYASIMLFSVTLVVSGCALVALARAAAPDAGWPAIVIAAVGLIGGLIGAVANFAEDWLRIPAFGPWFLAGVLPWGVAALGLGVVLVFRRRWRLVAIAPAISFLGFGLADRGGGVVVGVVWILAGTLLWRRAVGAE